MKSYKIRPFSRTSYRSTSRCDIVTSQILAGPVKINEHKQDEHGDIEKKGSFSNDEGDGGDDAR